MKNWIAFAFIALCLLQNTSQKLCAAGFALYEHSVSGLGNAFAGSAAVAEDASTVYFNPAGMSLLEGTQVYGGIHYIMPSAKFRNDGTSTLGAPTQGPNATSDEKAALPNLFISAPLLDDLRFGFGVSAPFGLATEYESDWVGRYVARRSHLSTILVNPAVAYRVNNRLSFGAGVDYMQAEAELSNALDLGLLFLSRFQSGGIPVNGQTLALASDAQANLGGPKYDGGVFLKGDGDGWGFNIGALYEIDERSRMGVHYRSGTDITLKGTVDFSHGLLEPFFGAAFPDQTGIVKLNLPSSVSISYFNQVTESLAIMADYSRTYWSSFEDLTIEFDEPSPPDTVLREDWEDVSRLSLGASYRVSPAWLARVGVSWDESPVPSDALRSPRIPDEDRIWLTVGATWSVNDDWDLSAAYLHIFVSDPAIDNSSHSTGQRLRGSIDGRVDLVSFGASRKW